MKELLQTLISQLKGTNGPTRVVIGAAIALALSVAGVLGFRAKNPHFVLLESNLDAAQLSSVSAAIAGENIRFDTSHPPGPYSIWVETSRQYEARNAIYLAGAMMTSPRGIDTKSGGASSVFLGHGERQQQIQKRKEGEVEKLLEVYNWIARATVSSSTPTRMALTRTEPPTISVVLMLRGISAPDREQRDTVATIVRAAFGVPDENVVISDQYGRAIYDGTRDKDLDEFLAFQSEYDASETERLQQVFDSVYGPGLVRASVSGEWRHDRVESIEEALDPSSKVPVSKTSSDTSTPAGGPTVGGPPGVSSNLVDASGSGTVANPQVQEPATTSETSEKFLVSRNTTHTLQIAPVLRRLTLTLLVDESLEERLADVEAAGKALVRFDTERGDVVIARTAPFFALERDADGVPVAHQPEPLPAPANPTMQLLLERGVEILAALAFLFVLVKSLKRSNKPIEVSERAPTLADVLPDEDVDMDLLARKHIEDLLQADPEKVGTMLSRWALGESSFTKVGK